jgi:hypothetical protein
MQFLKEQVRLCLYQTRDAMKFMSKQEPGACASYGQRGHKNTCKQLNTLLEASTKSQKMGRET